MNKDIYGDEYTTRTFICKICPLHGEDKECRRKQYEQSPMNEWITIIKIYIVIYLFSNCLADGLDLSFALWLVWFLFCPWCVWLCVWLGVFILCLLFVCLDVIFGCFDLWLCVWIFWFVTLCFWEWMFWFLCLICVCYVLFDLFFELWFVFSCLHFCVALPPPYTEGERTARLAWCKCYSLDWSRL